MNDYNSFCSKQLLENCWNLPVASPEKITKPEEKPKPKFNLWANVWVHFKCDEFEEEPKQGIIKGMIFNPENWTIEPSFVYLIQFEDEDDCEFLESEIFETE